MIQSRFVNDILDLLFDGDDNGKLLRKQIPYLLDSKYEFTGSGMYVSFTHIKGLTQQKVEIENSVIDGVEIKSSDLEIGADAKVFIQDGVISYLEIWSYSGTYPKNQLRDYILNQVWKGSPLKQIIKPRS